MKELLLLNQIVYLIVIGSREASFAIQDGAPGQRLAGTSRSATRT
ncbi:hypothetical protein [Arthrobacter sp. R4-81]